MPVEVRPLGVKCNISCHYCYQDGLREAAGPTHRYDLEAIKRAIQAKGGPFTLFGGEPLLMRKEDLEDLLQWGFDRFGRSSIQTNGVLIDEDHVRMFKKHQVQVGLSIDGPGELNSARWAGSLEKTEKATEKVEKAINLLLENGIVPSLIATLHRRNASAQRLPHLLQWFRMLDRRGVQHVRIHMLESDSDTVRADLALSAEENTNAMLRLDLLEREELKRLKFDLFRDIEALMLGKDAGVACIWRACDAYTTDAVQGIEGNGQSSNCGRTNKAGIDFSKADRRGFERYLALYHADQADGGCNGCEFFLMCKGQCPGTAIEGDWRNRTEHCETWKAVFRVVEHRLISLGYLPLSADPNRVVLERAMLGEWALGRNPPLQHVLGRMRQGDASTQNNARPVART
jgi:uncharacterized protein